MFLEISQPGIEFLILILIFGFFHESTYQSRISIFILIGQQMKVFDHMFFFNFILFVHYVQVMLLQIYYFCHIDLDAQFLNFVLLLALSLVQFLTLCQS